MPPTLVDQIAELNQKMDRLWDMARVQRDSEAFTPSSKNPFLRKINRVTSILQHPVVAHTLYNPHRGFVIDTRDPWKKGRLKVFVPMVHADTPEDDLPWAEKIEPYGGLEDHGSVLTLSAGTTVQVIFEAGFREAPLVMGCVHNVTRERGTGDQGLLMIEERRLWGGAPGRRTDAKNPRTNPDMKSLMPPWNNESYNTKDLAPGSKGTEQVATTTPNIYGFKSAEKHMVQWVDGDPKRSLFGKRLTIQSSRGSVLLFKDDEINTPAKIRDNPMIDDFKDMYPWGGYSAKPFNNHFIELRNTGVQMQSVGGHRVILSDEIEKDGTSNAWSAGWSPRGLMRSFVTIQSISEHKLILNDHEKANETRGPKDGAFLTTATGHFFGMQDDSMAKIAGKQRAIILWSTSGHRLEMNDYTAEVVSPRSGDGSVKHWIGRHKPSAKKAFFRLRSGWGQVIEMNDQGSQTENASQFIIIRNHNKDQGYKCKEYGPPWNYIRMQCVKNDRRFMIWGAGTFNISVCNRALRVVYMKNDYVGVHKGNKVARVFKGRIWERAEVGLVHWTTFGRIKLMVGRIIDDKLEFPLRQVIVRKKPYKCPVTGHVHFDTPSAHVFASE